jgi:hypothetical protein
MAVAGVAKKLVNGSLGLLGYAMVRAETRDRLHSGQPISEDSPKVAKESPLHTAEHATENFNRMIAERAEGELRRNSGAHNFRLIAKTEEPTVAVPQTYMQTLLRESLALRDQSGEIARLNRELALLKHSGSASNHSTLDAQPVKDVQAPAAGELYTPVYNYDGLRNDPKIIHNHDFMRDPRFMRAYRRAVSSAGVEYQHYYWRVHVALWCASLGLSLEGDFVECGVYRGLLSTSIMSYFDWNTINRKFFLFDTFEGVDERQLTDAEIHKGTIAYFREMYKENIYDDVVKNFAEFKNAKIVKGIVPYSLSTVDIEKVSYLSIDMNSAAPEIAAVNYFWDRLSPGAPILLDDYGFINYETQKKAFDEWAKEHNVQILALPTGQGLIIKPK